MPSPFPGMNPYIERDAVWNDFHSALCYLMKKTLVPQVAPEFYVKSNKHIYIHSEEPLRKSEALHEERVPFLEIFDKEYHSLVTVIELLSPTNKRKKKDREQFITKREQILTSSVHYVEIDLLRGGRRMPLDEMPACDYYVLISPADDRPEMGFWPISLRDALPVIPIPVPEPKTNVRIALQELLQQAYADGGYANYIYDGPPRPRLRRDDAAWAKQFLAASRESAGDAVTPKK